MEDSNLGQLQYIFTEDIYLFEEEKESITLNIKEGTSDSTKMNNQKNSGHTAQKQVDLPVQTDLESAMTDPIRVRGNFKKGILILHEEDELSPTVMEMLVNMINAIGHSMNEVGMLSSEELEGKSMENFKEINAHIVLKFGRIKHPVNALTISSYEVHTEEETEYLFADALSTISEDKNLKKKLWESLKILFNISQKK